ncbi:MAG: hypothetical protein C5B48_08795 [Candidatus Rokuibacteriota bacterium]|nr:MAG: hypothetical protein C5B48_08795 [Candidatus Rokubacteria bacterium]
MGRAQRSASLVAIAAFLLNSCVVPSTPVAPSAGVVAADARALRYGASAPEIFNNPQMREKLRALFGPDWDPGGAVAVGAPAFFPSTSAIRLVNIGDQDYIAITGCVTSACASHRGLLLIRQEGDWLMARLDEGGFSHYYSFGPGATLNTVPQAWIDNAWRAVQRVQRG